MFNSKKSLKLTFSARGFTLIELLIVIAILGTLAVVVLLALNPVQQLARTRDAGRISSVTQLGHAVEAWATSNGGVYPPEAGCAGGGATDWVGCLISAGEVAVRPATIAYSAGGVVTSCSVNASNSTWCYDANAATNGVRVIIFARLEGQANNSRCTGGNTQAWAVYSTADARGGIVCSANATTPPTVPAGAGVLTFLP